jgi:hypothetical protein
MTEFTGLKMNINMSGYTLMRTDNCYRSPVRMFNIITGVKNKWEKGLI